MSQIEKRYSNDRFSKLSEKINQIRVIFSKINSGFNKKKLEIKFILLFF